MVVGSSPVAVTIALVVAKLNFFSKFYLQNQHPRRADFWGILGPLLPQIEICPRGSILADEHNVWRTYEKIVFLWELDESIVCTFGPTLNLRYPL